MKRWPKPWLNSAIDSGAVLGLDLVHPLGDVVRAPRPSSRPSTPPCRARRRAAAAGAGGPGRSARRRRRCRAGTAGPWLCGSFGLPSNFHSLPSRRWAMPPQRQKHISQKVGIVVTTVPAGAGARPGPWPASATTATPPRWRRRWRRKPSGSGGGTGGAWRGFRSRTATPMDLRGRPGGLLDSMPGSLATGSHAGHDKYQMMC